MITMTIIAIAATGLIMMKIIAMLRTKRTKRTRRTAYRSVRSGRFRWRTRRLRTRARGGWGRTGRREEEVVRGAGARGEGIAAGFAVSVVWSWAHRGRSGVWGVWRHERSGDTMKDCFMSTWALWVWAEDMMPQDNIGMLRLLKSKGTTDWGFFGRDISWEQRWIYPELW